MIARQTLVNAIAVAAVCGAIVAGCGGGSHSSTVPAGTGTGTTPGGTQPANTAAIHVSITIPKANTSAVKRSPAFVSPATTQIVLIANPDNIPTDLPCVNQVCAGTIFVPVDTTSLTAKLENSASQVLSQSTLPVTLNPSGPNNITFTFDGVAAQFIVTSSVTQLVIGNPISVPITVTPVDAGGNPIVAPGNVVDAAGNLLISANGSTQNVSMISTNGSMLSQPALTWNPGTYTLTGTAAYNGGDPAVNPDQLDLQATNTAETVFGTIQLPTNPEAMFVIADPNNVSSQYQVLVGSAGSTTNTTVEIPQDPGSALTIFLQVIANYTPGSGGVTLAGGSDNCSGSLDVNSSIPNAFPTMDPVPYGTTFQFVTGPGDANQTCSFLLTDPTNGIATQVNVGVNNGSLVVQRKARK